MKLNDFQVAARMIEMDGLEAFRVVSERYGREIACVLIVAHLRRSFDSTKSYPPDPSIDERVKNFLEENNLLHFFERGY